MMEIISLVVPILCILMAIAATVLAFIFILPEKKRNKLPGFFRAIHDLFNFKYLVIEKVMQALYIFSTLFTVLYGFFSIFTSFEVTTYQVYDGYSFYTGNKVYHTETSYEWYGYTGILIMIFGPIVLRLMYEGVMLVILLVKNVIQINSKLKNQNEDAVSDSMFDLPKMPVKAAPAAPVADEIVTEEPVAEEPAAEQPVQPRATFCTKCGTALDANGNCPNCGQ